MSHRTRVTRWAPLPAGTPWLALLVAEALLLVAYFALTPAEVGREPRYLLYPFVWINAGLWAVHRAGPIRAGRRGRALGAVVGAAYFAAVMAIPGNVGLGTETAPLAVRVGWYAPGWGPLVAVSGPVRLYLVPFEVVGYASLSVLVAAAAMDAVRGALAGLLGLATCVGCTIPVLGPLVGLLGGPAAGLATTAYAWSYDLGTLLFLATLGTLSYARHRR